MSFMLIHFWGVRVLASLASMKGMLVNRLFDIGVVWWVLLTWSAYSIPSVLVLATSLLGEFGAVLNMLLCVMVSVKCVCIGIHS